MGGALLALVSGLLLIVAGGAPPATAAGSSDWKQVSLGAYHTCGVRTSGRLFCWGYNADGQLGNGSTVASLTPHEVDAAATNWVAVAAGPTHTCARRATGRLYCWGDNTHGQLGDGTTTARLSPVEVAGGWTNWTTPTTSFGFTCALRSTRRLYCWGRNGEGQLGNGTTQAALRPTQVAGAWTNWTAVAAGSSHTCGRRSTGRLYCWGANGSGQLGNATTTDTTRPSQVAGSRTDWQAPSSGTAHVCATRSNGRGFCWGNNAFGQLGNATTTNAAVPVQTAGARTDWAVQSAGGSHSCGRTKSGRLYCWGYGASGQLGDRATQNRLVPTQVAGGATDWRVAALGSNQTCATTTSGRAYCWGNNAFGQLGDGTMTGTSAPTEVYAP